MYSSQDSRLKSYGSKRCEVFSNADKGCVSKFDLLVVRGNDFVYIFNQSPAERQTRKCVKSVGDVSDLVNLPSCEGNESYKPTMGLKSETRSLCNIYLDLINVTSSYHSS